MSRLKIFQQITNPTNVLELDELTPYSELKIKTPLITQLPTPKAILNFPDVNLSWTQFNYDLNKKYYIKIYETDLFIKQIQIFNLNTNTFTILSKLIKPSGQFSSDDYYHFTLDTDDSNFTESNYSDRVIFSKPLNKDAVEFKPSLAADPPRWQQLLISPYQNWQQPQAPQQNGQQPNAYQNWQHQAYQQNRQHQAYQQNRQHHGYQQNWQQGGDNYKQKYLKYKSKYLQLKK
jgi:hypothetical protein